jgi:transcriptional regulator with XRE-family HTH domain
MNYGDRLKWIIKNRGFSQRDVSLKLGIAETTLSTWISKEFPPLEAIESVCRILEIPVSRFFAEDSDSYVEVSGEEMQILKTFGEFPEERRRGLLRIIEILRGW